jgi:hypothetical protein
MSQESETSTLLSPLIPEGLIEGEDFFLEQELYDDHGFTIVGNRKKQPIFF